jgi:hypothetical protein
MADYYQQTVVQEIIPDSDLTPLERLLLTNIFEFHHKDDEWFFFAAETPSEVITVDRRELEQALAASPANSSAHIYVTEKLADTEKTPAEIDLDLSGTSWEFFFQDIVKRSKTLNYIGVVIAFTCSKMRADGFGGMAVLITRDAIVGKTTGDFLEDMIAEAGLDDAPRRQMEARNRGEEGGR